MTGDAVLLCYFFCYPPVMGFMAVLTGHTYNLYMDWVFSNIRYNLMTIEAMPPIRSYGFMWFMTFITEELHRCIRRNIYFYRLFNNFFLGLEIFNIDGCISDKLFSDLLVSVTEETFLPLVF